MKIVLVGPCGVGKSTVAKLLANRTNVAYFDFDEIGIQDMQKRKGQISPFSASRLNLMQSIPTIILSTKTASFVLDIGGDTVFRNNADNEKRLAQVLWLKETYTSQIIVLTAQKVVLQRRFLSTKKKVKTSLVKFGRTGRILLNHIGINAGTYSLKHLSLQLMKQSGKLKQI